MRLGDSNRAACTAAALRRTRIAVAELAAMNRLADFQLRSEFASLYGARRRTGMPLPARAARALRDWRNDPCES
jgi:hypothetical protein